MTIKQKTIMASVVLVAMGGVFLGAGADGSWAALAHPQFVIGSLVSGAAALGGFLSKGPN